MENLIITQKCVKCRLEKSLNYFNKQKESKTGYRTICRACDKVYNERRYKKLKSKIIEKVLKWQKKNIPKLREYKYKYFLKHKKISSNQNTTTSLE